MDGTTFTNALTLATATLMFALMVATVNERLVEKLAKPIVNRIPVVGDYADYVALLTGALISVGFGIDLFTPIATAVGVQMTASWAGMALTAAIVGGGSHFIHDIWPTGNTSPAPAVVNNYK